MSKEQIENLEKVKKFLLENPEAAKQLFENDPTIKAMIAPKEEVPVTLFGGPTNTMDSAGNGIGGQRKSLSIPGRANLYDNNQNGFSNYFMLAIFAFVIQFAITLICIFFYK